MSTDDGQHGTTADLFFWIAAITAWHETGSTIHIQEGLRNGRPIPPFARTFMADLLGKQIKRKPTREANNRRRRDDFIRGNYRNFLKRLQHAKKSGRLKCGQVPSDIAKMELAKIYGLEFDTIEKIVKTRAKKG